MTDGASKHSVSVLDVFDAYFDGDASAVRIKDLSIDDCDDLAERLLDFYARWVAPPAEEGEFRVGIGDAALLSSTLLYANKVAIADPVAEWLTSSFDYFLFTARLGKPGRTEQHFRVARDELAIAYERVERWRDLIHAGLVVPSFPLPSRLLELQASVRGAPDYYDKAVDTDFDEPLPGDLTPSQRQRRLFGLGEQIAEFEAAGDTRLAKALRDTDEGSPDPDQIAVECKRHFASLTLAELASAQFLPTTTSEWAYFEHRMRMAGETLTKHTALELSVIPTLAVARLPLLESLEPKTILSLRTDEEAFVDWQLLLRSAVRKIREPTTSQDFAAEAQGVLEETLLPITHDVQRAVSRSSRLTRAAKERALALSLGTAATGGAVAASVLPPLAALPPAITALAEVTVRVIFGSSLSGRQTVIARLLEASKDG